MKNGIPREGGEKEAKGNVESKKNNMSEYREKRGVEEGGREEEMREGGREGDREDERQRGGESE